MENRLSHISQGNNIWKYVHPTFHPYAPPFKGLTTSTGIITDHQLIANTLADFYEKHFEYPTFDINNDFHLDVNKKYEYISKLPNFPLDNITLEEVEENWKKAKKKKSTDNEGLSGFIFHQLPREYLQIFTIAYNKVACTSGVLLASKHAK